MSLIVKICGLSTAEALEVGAGRRRRHGRLRVLSAVAAAHLRSIRRSASDERVRGRAQKVALTVDADDAGC